MNKWIPLLALVVWTAAVLPVAQKAVLECGSHCHRSDQTVVSYRLLGLNARTSDEGELEQLPGPRHGGPDWYFASIPHQDGNTPLLAWGSVATIVAAPIAAFFLHAHARGGQRLPALVTYGALLAAEAAFCAGVVFHSATWSATQVSLLTPHVGAIALAIAPLSGLALLASPEPAMPGLPPLDHNLQGR